MLLAVQKIALLKEDGSEVCVGPGIVRIDRQSFLPAFYGTRYIAGISQRNRQVVIPGGWRVSVQGAGLSIFLSGFTLLIVLHEDTGKSIVSDRIVWIALEHLTKAGDRLRSLVLFHLVVGGVKQAVELGGLGIDVLHSVWRDIHKFGNVDGAIGRGHVVHQNGWTVVTV